MSTMKYMIPEKLLWAKTGNGEENTSWMTLKRHLADTADVEPYAWSRFVSKSLENSMTESIFNYTKIDHEEALESLRKMSRFMAGIHDVGKANPVFQSMLHDDHDFISTNLFNAIGEEPPDESYHNKDLRHEEISGLSLMQWIVKRLGLKYSRKTVKSIYRLSCIVTGHHGYYDYDKSVESVIVRNDEDSKWNVWLDGFRSPKDRRWTDVRLELIDWMADRTGVTESDVKSWLLMEITPWVQMILSGVLVTADWMASDQNAFPCTPDGVIDCNEHERLENGISRLGIPDGWTPSAWNHKPLTDDDFHSMFPGVPSGAVMNKIQESMVRTVETPTPPGLVICEAPMGCGKTEAALMSASILAERYKCSGLEFALPTMATTNAMYPRVISWANSDMIGAGRAPVSLQHGDAWLNSEWGRDERRRGDWLSRRQTSSMASVDISTIDHLLGMGLKHGHVDLDHLGYSGKVIIIDEVHSADEYMMTYVTRTLSWLGAYKTPVIILSATLSKSMRRRLVEAYSGMEIDWLSDGYPMITSVDDNGHVNQTIVPTGDATNVIHIDGRVLDTVPTEAVDSVKDGGCAAIVMDTVKAAQDMVEMVKSEADSREIDVKVMLLHSRYCKQDRQRLEDELITMLGPNGDRPERLIVVATQVIEQSLDIDFDVMWSQVAPIDSLLQRAGRLHRRSSTFRPTRLEEPVLHVIDLPDVHDEIPRWLAKNHSDPITFVYDRSILIRTIVALNDHNTIMIPDEISDLVRSVYDDKSEPSLPDDWLDVLRSTTEDHSTKLYRDDVQSNQHVIDGPEINDLMHLTRRMEDKGNAGVRNGLESLPVIIIKTNEDGTYSPAADQSIRMYGEYPPDWDLGRTLYKSMVGLPGAYSSDWAIDNTIKELEEATASRLPGWVEDGSSVKGELSLILDDYGNAELNGRAVHYDSILGLVDLGKI